MPKHYWLPSGELAAGLVLPPDIQRRIRVALASIEAANSPVNCLIAQATAQGICLGLDMGRVLARSDIERIEILVDNVAGLRLAELAGDAQP